MNVYLSGMIGSGKTTIGRRIAEKLGWSSCDLDEEMNRILGYSFHRLVAEQGWLPFRELEYAICKDLAGRDQSIVCLGGGTVRYQWNVDVLRGSGVVVLLEVSEAELVRRVRARRSTAGKQRQESRGGHPPLVDSRKREVFRVRRPGLPGRGQADRPGSVRAHCDTQRPRHRIVLPQMATWRSL